MFLVRTSLDPFQVVEIDEDGHRHDVAKKQSITEFAADSDVPQFFAVRLRVVAVGAYRSRLGGA